MENPWLEFAKKVHAIAETGLTYKNNEYDIERYEQLKQLSFEMMGTLSDTAPAEIAALFAHQKGYQTPKVDVRGVVILDGKILMVREKTDGKWTLPGGWADVGLTPNENVVKEMWEETGLMVEPVRLLSVLDKKVHNHPPTPWYCYKIFVLCRITGGELMAGMEILDTGYFAPGQLPELSEERITKEQIEMVFDLVKNGKVRCD